MVSDSLARKPVLLIEPMNTSTLVAFEAHEAAFGSVPMIRNKGIVVFSVLPSLWSRGLYHSLVVVERASS